MIFCQSKTVEQVAVIFEHLAAREANVLGTRASAEQAEAVKKTVLGSALRKNGGLLLLERAPVEKIGRVAVCTAGTADIRWRKKPLQRQSFTVRQLTAF